MGMQMRLTKSSLAAITRQQSLLKRMGAFPAIDPLLARMTLLESRRAMQSALEGLMAEDWTKRTRQKNTKVCNDLTTSINAITRLLWDGTR
jgi:hypothetical protein